MSALATTGSGPTIGARPTIGRRRRRFVLELPLEAPDGFGGVIRTWQPGPQIWGSLRLLSAAERVQGAAREDVATHRAVLPFRDNLSSAMRLTLGLRRFRIRHVDDPDGQRRLLDCWLEEVAR